MLSHKIKKSAEVKFEKFLTPAVNFEIPKPDKNLFSKRLRVALLREQGINGHYDMAAALIEAGFEVDDVHMSEIGSKIKDLNILPLTVGGDHLCSLPILRSL